MSDFAQLLPPSDPCLRCGRCAGCHAPNGDCPVPNTSCPIGRCPSGTWLNGYQFALRNLASEAVQADLARIRAESGVMTQASGLPTSQPPTGRESGGTCPPRTHWCDR